MADIYIATQDGVVAVDGELVTIRAGVTRVEDGHKLLKQNPSLFKPASEGVHFSVRTAKTEPKVAKKTAAKKAASKDDED